MKRKLLQQDVLRLVAVKALLTPESKLRDLAFRLLLELTFDDEGIKAIKENQHVMTLLELNYKEKNIARQVLWMLDDEVTSQTKSLRTSLTNLKLKQKDLESSFLLLQSNLGLIYAMNTAVHSVESLLKADPSSCLQNLSELNSVFESQKDMGIIGDFLAKINFCHASLTFIAQSNQKKEDLKDILKNIQEICLTFTSWSQNFTIHLATSNLIQILTKEINNLLNLKENMLVALELYTIVRTFYNIAKLSSGQTNVLHEIPVLEALHACANLQTESLVAMTALMSLSFIYEQYDWKLDLQDDSAVSMIILTTSRALTNENHFHDRFNVSELLTALRKICKVSKYAQKLIQLNIVSLLKTVLEKGTNIEIEFCESLLREIAKDSWCLQEIQKDKELTMWLDQLYIELSENIFEINTIKNQKMLTATKPMNVNSKPSNVHNRYLPKELILDVTHETSPINKIPFIIEQDLQEIGITCQDFCLNFGEMDVGQSLLSVCKVGIKCVKYLPSGTESETLSDLEELRSTATSLWETDLAGLADFLCKINFCQKSYERYKEVLKMADLEHFDVNLMEKISGDGRQLLDVIRDCWRIFSGISLQFALQLADSRILPELTQDMVIMINKSEKELDGSFLYTSTVGVLYNLAKFTDSWAGQRIQKLLQHEKLVDVLGNFLHFKPELSVQVLLTLALIVDRSQIHLLISHSSIFCVLPASRDEWEEKKILYGNMSIGEVLVAITKIAKNEKIWKILELQKREILPLMLNVLKFGDEAERKQVLAALWELSLDANILKKLKTNVGLILCVKNLANIFETKVTEATTIARMILNNISDNTNGSEELHAKKSREERVNVMISYVSVDEGKVSQVIELLSPHVQIMKCVDGKSVNNETVNQAEVLLICLSFNFLTLGRTLSIINRAFKLDIPMIFLIFEKQMKLETYMEILLGANTLIDFSTVDDAVVMSLVQKIQRTCTKSYQASQHSKKRKILTETLPETIPSYPWDSLNSYCEVISSKEITKALNKLQLPIENVQALLVMLKENSRLFTVFRSVAQCTICLSGASDLACYNTLEELLTRVTQPREKENIFMGQFLCHFGFCDKSLGKYRSVLSNVGCRHASDLDDKNNIPELSRHIIINLLECWKQFSKCSPMFALKLAESDIFQELEDEVIEKIGIHPQKLAKSQIFDSCINTLYHMALIPSVRQNFRERQFVYALGNFLSYRIDLTPKLLVTIALTLDEYQTHLLTSQPNIFNRLLPRSKSEWTSQEHGISCKDLLSTLNELSKKDKVKELLVQKDILLLITNILLSDSSSPGEKEEAIKLLMELSFSSENKTKIKSLIYKTDAEVKPSPSPNNNTDVGNLVYPVALQSAKTSTDLLSCIKMLVDKGNSESRKAANRILWWLQMDMKAKETSKQTTSQGQGHIMISYNSSDRETLKKVYDALRTEGYKVWMDIYEIKGSSLDSMAKAVEHSEVILMCMSEKYKESANCRLEAEYAANCGKPIIPLLMQHSYKPNGWLGILLGSKIFYEFSGERYTFKDKMQDLIREIGNRGKITDISLNESIV
ncbi:uncharacterized protein LOC106060007 isoform X2 [Biomphalaria glabrata]|nr:uncharacterized protein LOC106060007 isoform X2 [Biomphalaria glabrata]